MWRPWAFLMTIESCGHLNRCIRPAPNRDAPLACSIAIFYHEETKSTTVHRGQGVACNPHGSRSQDALAEVGRLWGAAIGTPEGDRLDILATLIDEWETGHIPMEPPQPFPNPTGHRKETPR